MEYTVHKLASMAHVSPRTIRYYDEIGLLKPARTSSSGYRIYGAKEIDRLQQILFYRELGVDLESIAQVLSSPGFDPLGALEEHRENLIEKRVRIDQLIANLEKTISSMKEGIEMSDKEKFEGFKEKLIEDNEAKYGEEIREKYGDDVVDASNEKLKSMTAEQYSAIEQLAVDIIETLKAAMEDGDPAGEKGQRAAELHKEWLMSYWPEYSKEAHAGLGRMYVDDGRFTQYYDQHREGMAAFLRDAILVFTGEAE